MFMMNRSRKMGRITCTGALLLALGILGVVGCGDDTPPAVHDSGATDHAITQDAASGELAFHDAALSDVITSDQALTDQALTDQALTDQALTDQSKPTNDATPMPDKGPPTSGLTCAEIGACSDTCAGKCPGGLSKIGCMIKCSTDCKAKGCASAKPVYDTLYNCVNAKCGIACFNGPTTGCKSCISSKCGTQEKACTAQKC